jgi:hypothetical protein
MNLKVLKDRNLKPTLIAPKGINVKHASSYCDELFFVLAETGLEKTEKEIQLEKKVTRLQPIALKKGNSEERKDLIEALNSLRLEQAVRHFENYHLHIGGYGDLNNTNVHNLEIVGGEVHSVEYNLGRTRGKLVLYSQPEEAHKLFAIHGRKKLNLTRLI